MALTNVLFIIDESGSMHNRVEDVIGGFNTYVDELRKEDSTNEYRISLTKFSDRSRVVFTDRDLKNVPKLTYTPGGGTALYDAIGDTLSKVVDGKDEFCVNCGARSHSYNFCPSCGRKLQATAVGKYIVIIMTDGDENSSSRFRKHHITQQIKDKESLGNWTFVYLGANQDAMKEGMALGIPMGNTWTYDTAQSKTYFSQLATGTAGVTNSTLGSSVNFAGTYFDPTTSASQYPGIVNYIPNTIVQATHIPSQPLKKIRKRRFPPKPSV